MAGNGVSEHGFDLTGFKSAEDFKKLLRQNKLKGGRRVSNTYGSKQFVFMNKNLKLITGNNPITGQYADKGRRQNEKGYASYIGIRGKPSLVKKLASGIKRRASFIKGESVGRRDFI